MLSEMSKINFPYSSVTWLEMKMESTGKLSKVNFQWTETLYQNNSNNITEYCILFYIFQGLKM